MLLNHNETSSLITVVKPQRQREVRTQGETEHERVSLMYRLQFKVTNAAKEENLLKRQGLLLETQNTYST